MSFRPLRRLKMNVHRIKFIVIISFVTIFAAISMINVAPTRALANSADDPAVEYKAKCAVCHTPNASKFFDPAKSDEIHVETILKGKKGEKPPYMPGFEAKGMTADGAKALTAYMKGLRAVAK
jgi:mono/diheme cytochrome c family protein